MNDLATADVAESTRPLKIVIAGSVDNGKSTLTGRLLYDADLLMDDQIAALQETLLQQGDGPDFASLTDGLTDEKEQGITIDVAYRFINVGNRRIVFADVPGHEQYTRNMVTAASDADAVVILIDAWRGTTRQTWRHLFLSLLLGVKDIIVAVNKMDRIGYDASKFFDISEAIQSYGPNFKTTRIHIVPISAKMGDNVVSRSTAMPWYQGPPLFTLLTRLQAVDDAEDLPFRLPVRYVSRPGENSDRTYMGRISQGSITRGEKIRIMPGKRTATVKEIHAVGRPVERAGTGQSVSLSLYEDIDIGRGDVLSEPGRPATATTEFEAVIFWFGREELNLDGRYIFHNQTKSVPARVSERLRMIDVEKARLVDPGDRFAENDIGIVKLRLQSPVAIDDYCESRSGGSFLLIDEFTNETVAAGLIGTACLP